MADAFHQAAIASDDVGIMIGDVAIARIGQTLTEGHADCVAEALAEWAGGGLDA